jgi:photosystem II stability/assembly factor-like uncharacterized protein
MQDLGTASGPSNSLAQAGIVLSDWHPVGGGEAGFTAPDPSDPEIVYGSECAGYLSRYDHRTRWARNVSIYPFIPIGHAAEDVKYRFQWTAPVLVSPHDPKVVYHAANVLFQTSDAGMHWTPISPDLTRNDKSKQKWSGGPIWGDNGTTEFYCTIFALAESPLQKGLLWAGSDDGLVHVSRDSGKHWSNVTPQALPEWGTVCCIEASSFSLGTAYVVVDAHKLDDMRPYLFKTTDFGQTWTGLAARLPQDVHLYAIREDPKRKGLLYLGTEQGVSFSVDDGAAWQALKLNLPSVAVTDLVVKDTDLVLSTNGRSIWILDDLTPIRQMTPDTAAKDAYLFPPRPAVRYRYQVSLDFGQFPGSKSSHPNPSEGVGISYYLKRKPQEDIALEIFDHHGALVEKLSSKLEPEEPQDPAEYPFEVFQKPVLTTHVGVNRIAWNLTYDGPTLIKGGKPYIDSPQAGPLVLPGTYRLKLTVAGKTYGALLEVKPDPRLATALAARFDAGSGLHATELENQLKLALALRDDISRVSRMVERLRAVRKQLVDRNELVRNVQATVRFVKASEDLLGKLDELEGKLHNAKAETSEDIFAQKGGAKLYAQLHGLYSFLRDSDGAPTQGMKEVYAEHSALLNNLEVDFNRLLSEDLARLNELARRLEVPSALVPKEAARKK